MEEAIIATSIFLIGHLSGYLSQKKKLSKLTKLSLVLLSNDKKKAQIKEDWKKFIKHYEDNKKNNS